MYGSEKEGKELFDAHVKNMLKAWRFRNFSGLHFVQAAQWIAAQHGLLREPLYIIREDLSRPAPLSLTLELHYQVHTLTVFESCYPIYMPTTEQLYWNQTACGPFTVDKRTYSDQSGQEEAFVGLAAKLNQTRAAKRSALSMESDDEEEEDHISDDEAIDFLQGPFLDTEELEGPQQQDDHKHVWSSRFLKPLENDDVQLFHDYVSHTRLEAKLWRSADVPLHMPTPAPARARKRAASQSDMVRPPSFSRTATIGSSKGKSVMQALLAVRAKAREGRRPELHKVQTQMSLVTLADERRPARCAESQCPIVDLTTPLDEVDEKLYSDMDAIREYSCVPAPLDLACYAAYTKQPC